MNCDGVVKGAVILTVSAVICLSMIMLLILLSRMVIELSRELRDEWRRKP